MRDGAGIRGRRVCIVTPTHLGSTPRVVKEADALHESGLEVTVIAVRTLDSVEARDQAILERARWRVRRIDLRSAWRRLPARIVQATAQTFGRTLPAAWTADMRTSALTPHLAAAASTTPADLFIAHYPAALPAAAAAARVQAARLAFDAEDFHAGEVPNEAGYAQTTAGIREIEARYLPRCSYVTAASPGIADAYATAYGINRPTVVLNTFPLAERMPGPANGDPVPTRPSIYWFSQVIGPDRGLACAIHAIGRAATRPHLHLRGEVAPDFRGRLEQYARTAGASGRVHLLAPARPDEMVRLAAELDAGLVAETGHTLNRRIALTNKLFTYLAAGVPAIMSDVEAHRAFAREAGVEDWLYETENPDSLAARLDQWFGDGDRLAAARARATALAHGRYHWEADRAELIAAVTKALTGPCEHRLMGARGMGPVAAP